MAKQSKFYKLPNYEVLELLSNEKGVCGFHIHFSNGSKATYSRTTEGSECCNILFNNDGSIHNFWIGSISALEPVWKVNGKLFET